MLQCDVPARAPAPAELSAKLELENISEEILENPLSDDMLSNGFLFPNPQTHFPDPGHKDEKCDTTVCCPSENSPCIVFVLVNLTKI